MGIELNAKSLLEIRFPSRENGPEMDLKTQQASLVFLINKLRNPFFFRQKIN
jgi:hypothetical protein